MKNYRDLLGVKYTPQGRSIEEGFDCYGLAIEVLKRNGITLIDVFDKNVSNVENMLIALNSIPHTVLNKPEENCLIELSVFGEPKHIAVYIGSGYIIHTSKTTGVIIEPLHRYSTRIKGIYKV